MHEQQKNSPISAVLNALDDRLDSESLAQIARNAGLPYGWLQQFAYGNIKEPGYTKLVTLAAYLDVVL